MKEESKASLERAHEAIHRADFPEAISLLSGLLTEDSDNAEAWQQLGVCYLETRQPDLAVEALTRAVKSGSPDALTHYLLGNAYGSTGQLESAAACYRRALEADPRHAKAEEFLIRAESLLESREHYRKALKFLYSPEPDAASLNSAVRELVQSVAIFDGSPASDNLRECARKLFQFKREQLVPAASDPELDRWARACARGIHCIRAGNWLGAQETYEEALNYRQQDAFVHHALGFCFAELDDVARAVRAWLRVLELDAAYDFTSFGCVERAQ